MDSIVHLPEFQVVVCKKCKYVVLPSIINAHFAAKPKHGLSKEERQCIVAEIAEIDGLIKDNEDLRQYQFPFPSPTSLPIKELAEPKRNGIRCTFKVGDKGRECSFICCSLQQIQKHC